MFSSPFAVNPIGALKEMCDKFNYKQPTYEHIKSKGPDHNKEFTIICTFNGIKAEGVAKTLKEAKKNSALNLIHKLNAEQQDPTLTKPNDTEGIDANYIGKLNEICAKLKINQPTYTEVKIEEFNLNNLLFTIACSIKELNLLEEGKATTKKEAKQLAAKNVYKKYTSEDIKIDRVDKETTLDEVDEKIDSDPITNVPDDLRQIFIEYFNMGLTPKNAVKFQKLKFLDVNYSNIHIKSKNVPSIDLIHTYFRQWRDSSNNTNENPFELLKQKQAYYKRASELFIDEDNYCVSILTPSMRRAHKFPNNDLVFITSVNFADFSNHVVTFIFNSSKIGAIPLGCSIHNQENYEQACKNLKDLIGKNGFKGKGYPEMCIIDENYALEKALKKIFPESKKYGNLYIVSRTLWKWLWNFDNKIKTEDRPILMELFMNIMYATDESKCEEAFGILKNHDVSRKYPNFLIYIDTLWVHHSKWCLYNRPELKEDNIKMVQLTIRIFMDVVLKKCKTFNVYALTDIITTTLEEEYKKRYEELINSDEQKLNYFHFSDECNMKVFKISDTLYELELRKNVPRFKVFTDLQMCNCHEGIEGVFCKHLYSIYKLNSNIQTPTLSVEDKNIIKNLLIEEKENKDEGLLNKKEIPVLKSESRPIIKTNFIKEKDRNMEKLELQKPSYDDKACNKMHQKPQNRVDNKKQKFFKRESKMKVNLNATDVEAEYAASQYNKEMHKFLDNMRNLEHIVKSRDHTLLPYMKQANNVLENIKSTQHLITFITTFVGNHKKIDKNIQTF